MEPQNLIYTRISRDWHKLKTPQGVFFGYSLREVLGKAKAAERRAGLQQARE